MPITSDSTVAEVLDDYGKITRAELKNWLHKGDPEDYLYGPMSDYPMRGGRMFRPSLCIATAKVFGASLEQVIPAAVSIELLHNALLIHDDIEDESDERRGKPTLHKKIGTPLALNAGDSLAFLSLRPIIRGSASMGYDSIVRILEEFDQMAQQTAEGQALDLGWRRDNHIELCEADYLKMVLKKTCWLTTLFPIRLGALIGSGGRANLDSLFNFAFFLGAAFQIQDDVLNLIGNHERYGKELGGDLLEGKRTLMLVNLLELSSSSERVRIKAILDTPRDARSDASVSWLRSAMIERGCIEYAKELAHGLAGAASHEFDKTFKELPESSDKAFLSKLPSWVIERS